MTEETLKPVAWMSVYKSGESPPDKSEPLVRLSDAQSALAERDKRIAELGRERDAAFTMSRCECDVDECCFNLVKHIDRATSAEAEAARLRALLAEAREVVKRAQKTCQSI